MGEVRRFNLTEIRSGSRISSLVSWTAA